MSFNKFSATGKPKSDEIEARMQSVQATLRQERDKARRNYELAMERIGLLRDEVECVESSVQERQMQLAKINQERKQVDAKVSIRTKVENLAKEFSFQHAEILSKEEKLRQLHDSLREAAQTRQKKLRETSQIVAEHREKLDGMFSVPLHDLKKEVLEDELKDEVIHERFAGAWPSLIQIKDQIYQEETSRMQDCLTLTQHIIERYVENFGLGEMEDHVTDMMCVDEEGHSPE